MNHRTGFQEGLWWLMVYLLVFITPLEFLREVNGNLTKDQATKAREEKIQWLDRTSRQLLSSFEPTETLKFFFRDLQGPEALGLLETIERRFPGGLKALRFDYQGNPLPVPASQRFEETEIAEKLSSLFLKNGVSGRTSLKQYQQIPELKPDLTRIQNFLGPGVPLDILLSEYSIFFKVNWRGTPTGFFWTKFNSDWPESPSSAPPGTPQGYLLAIDLNKIPQSFFIEMALKTGSTRIPKTLHSLGILDLVSPNQSLFREGFSTGGGEFLTALKTAYLRHSKEQFEFGTWLGTTIQVNIEPTKKVILLADLTDAISTEQTALAYGNQIFRILACLGFLALMAIQKGVGKNLSLSWRGGVLLILSVLLPLAGIYWAGSALITGIEKQERTGFFNHFREVANFLPHRLQSFVPEYGKLISNWMSRMKGTFHSQENLMEQLNRGRDLWKKEGGGKTGWFTDYFLSDSKGKLVFATNTSVPEETILYKLLLKNISRDHLGAKGEGNSLLGDAIVEEMGQFSGSEGTTFSSPPLGVFSEIKLGRGTSFLLPMLISLGGPPQILMFQCRTGLLEFQFIRNEYKRGMIAYYQKKFHGKAQYHFKSFQTRSPDFTEKVAILQQEGIKNFEKNLREISGEFQYKNHPFLFFASPQNSMQTYRFIGVASEREILQHVTMREGWLRLWFVIVLCMAFLMGIVMSRQMIQPIRILDQGLEKVREGDLNVVLPELGGDEIGRLGTNFNHMVRELREKERMQAYVSETVLEAIRNPDLGRNLDAQTREVTILFSDIRGFTSLSEQHSAQEMFSMLNEYFETVEAHLRKYGGQVQKFIGDAVYAVFPEEGEAGARAAVRASVEMINFLETFNQGRTERGLFPIGIGIGIATGKVLLGKLGSEERMDYAYIGEEVHLASLMETASKLGKHSRIILSPQTYALVSELVQTEKLVIPIGHEAGPLGDLHEVRHLF